MVLNAGRPQPKKKKKPKKPVLPERDEWWKRDWQKEERDKAAAGQAAADRERAAADDERAQNQNAMKAGIEEMARLLGIPFHQAAALHQAAMNGDVDARNRIQGVARDEAHLMFLLTGRQ